MYLVLYIQSSYSWQAVYKDCYDSVSKGSAVDSEESFHSKFYDYVVIKFSHSDRVFKYVLTNLVVV